MKNSKEEIKTLETLLNQNHPECSCEIWKWDPDSPDFIVLLVRDSKYRLACPLDQKSISLIQNTPLTVALLSESEYGREYRKWYELRKQN